MERNQRAWVVCITLCAWKLSAQGREHGLTRQDAYTRRNYQQERNKTYLVLCAEDGLLSWLETLKKFKTLARHSLATGRL